MRITIQPVRHTRGRWVPTDFQRAQAYELRTKSGRRLRRIQSLQEAKRLAALLDSQRARRSREAILGCRYSEVREEVAARNATVIASSLPPTKQ